jgi:outer membrane receptor protein involved in Fe transport
MNFRGRASGFLALLACSGSAAAQSGAAVQKSSNSTPRQIVVTGTRRSYDTSIDRSTYRIGSDVQAANGSIADVLRNIPSVDVDLQGNVSLRGQGDVTILVDGKPTTLFSGPGGGLTLQQIPASQYDRVEVMTNPSAAYAAKGSGGIINLITRKNRANGAVATARGAWGTRGRRSAGASVSDKFGKLSVTADGSMRRDPQFSTDITDFTELSPSGQPLVSSHEVTKGVGNLHLWTARGGADLDLNKDDRLSTEVHHTTFVFHSDMTTDLVGTDPAGTIVRRFDRNGFFQQNRFDTEGSLSFRHDTQGKGSDVTASLTYEKTLEDSRDRFDNVDVLPTGPDLFDNVSRFGKLGRLEAKADFVSPLKTDSSLQAGIDVEKNHDRYEDRGGFGSTAAIAAVPEPAFTDLFHFDRSVAAAYAIYERPFGELTAQAGIRIEDEQHHFSHEGAPMSGSHNDARLFPSLHLQWKKNKTVDVKASISTRIARPDPSDFDAFRRFVDPFHFVAGNPALKPETTVSFEAGIERKKGKSLDSATLYYRSSRNGVTDVSEEISDGVLLATRENLRGSTSLGLELIANGPLTKTINYRLSGNFARFIIDAVNLGFGHRSALVVSGKAGMDWQPDKRDLAQVNMSLTGKQLLPQGVVHPMLLVNLGYRHRLTPRLFGFITAQDALHTYKRHSRLNTPRLIERSFDSAKTQAAFVDLSYDVGGKSARDPAFDYSS